jgi:hypothetical protein
MGLLEYQDMPFLRVAHDGVLMFCVHLVKDQPQTGASGVVLQSQAAWTVHHVKNHTLLGHSVSASQAGRRVGQAL